MVKPEGIAGYVAWKKRAVNFRIVAHGGDKVEIMAIGPPDDLRFYHVVDGVMRWVRPNSPVHSVVHIYEMAKAAWDHWLAEEFNHGLADKDGYSLCQKCGHPKRFPEPEPEPEEYPEELGE